MSTHASAALRQLPVFASLSQKALDVADSLATSVNLADGHVLCRQGSVGLQAFLIVTGTAEISQDDVVIGTAGPGDLVGELALLGDLRRTASVTATSPITALVMNAAEFASLLDIPAVKVEFERIATEHVDRDRQRAGDDG